MMLLALSDAGSLTLARYCLTKVIWYLSYNTFKILKVLAEHQVKFLRHMNING
jgi:hypothetical protein